MKKVFLKVTGHSDVVNHDLNALEYVETTLRSTYEIAIILFVT